MMRDNRKLLCIVCTLGLLTLCCGEDNNTSDTNVACKTPGYVSCNGRCIDPTTSSDYCGANEYCEGYEVCRDNQSCQAGKCIDKSEQPKDCNPPCEADQTCQNGKCVEKAEAPKDCTDSDWKCESNKLLKCQDGKWESVETCPENTQCNAETGSCQKTDSPKTDCLDTEHLFANKCEADDETHCGSHTNDCTKLSGWKKGNCIDKTCFAEECNAGYHLASLYDNNNHEITSCEEDTHGACGSVNTKCGDNEVCTNGECQENCKPGEVICGGSCINPMTSNNFCGADASCSSYLACSEFETCSNGQCVLSSCKNAGESLCTENGQNVCINIHGNNPNHCGTCDTVCSEKATAKTSCQNGQCIYTCNAGTTNCGSDTEPICLSEEQLKSDPTHCGSCDKKCADNEFCQNGKCIVSSCNGSQCLWNNACINQDDHCGTQCVNCNTANLASAGICQGGSCTITSCITGYHLTNQGVCEIDSATACPNGNANGTVNCNTLDAYTKTGICVEGKCQATACQSNAHLKNGKCIADTVNACGSSETNCSKITGWSDGYCSEGKCIAKKCQSGYCVNALTNQCTNEQSISACGADGGYCKSCNQTQICSAGKCIAKQCDGNVCNQSNNPQTMSCKNDNTHCGSGCQNCNTFTSHATAGNCLADGTCQVTACETKYHVYNNTCEADSIMNCGTHGAQCNVANANNECKNKVCVSTCKYGFEFWEGACARPKFISVWETSQQYPTIKQKFYAPKDEEELVIDWGDGNIEKVLPGKLSSDHTYNTYGLHTVTITGVMRGLTFVDYGYNNLVSIQSYGKSTLRRDAFRGASSLESLPTDEAPRLSDNSMWHFFEGAKKFNSDISFWDTSNIEIMDSLFKDATSFNQPLNNWDTSKVTSMGSMFSGASSFNQPLDNWDTSNVTVMNYMFSGASAFNQPLNNWDTSNVTSMVGMFAKASSFNQPLNNWNTSKVTNIQAIFAGATKFNQDISNWDVSHVDVNSLLKTYNGYKTPYYPFCQSGLTYGNNSYMSEISKKWQTKNPNFQFQPIFTSDCQTAP